jgi:electron transport complex protein RnfA
MWTLIIGGLFVNNILMVQFLGVCPFLGLSKKTDSALGMGVAVTFVMTITSLITFLIYKLLLQLNIEWLYIIVFILVIASIVQILEMAIKKFSPALYNTMGIYLPLITTNCAVLGIAKINIAATEFSILEATLNGFVMGIGFTIAIVMLAGIREKIDKAKIAAPFKGFPISLVAAALMAMAFSVFA